MIKLVLLLSVLAVCLGFVEWYGRTTDDSGLAIRKAYFLKNASEIDGLIFGPSLLIQGINPQQMDGTVANLALTASAPNADVKMLDYALERSDPEYIIFDLNPGAMERFKEPLYFSQRKLHYYFGLDYPGMKLKDHLFVSYPLYRYFFRGGNQRGLTNAGFPTKVAKNNDDFRRLNYDKARISKRMERAERLLEGFGESEINYTRNVELLEYVIKTCRDRGIKVFFVSPPFYPEALQLLNPRFLRRRQRFVDRVVDNEHVFFLDYSTALGESPHLFFNVNHVNPAGAEIFTKMLNYRIRQLRDLDD